MTGKIFPESNNIYQDQAKILFNYYQQAAEKIVSEEERIDLFWHSHDRGSAYSGHDLFEWHGILTGSCRAGRDQFVRDKGIDLNRTFTVEEFVSICRDAYGGEIIAALNKANGANGEGA